jgi:hypothetical protein
MNLPRHIELSIHHNPHRGDYETIERWLELNEQRDGAEITPADRAAILATGELWVVRWYPETPVGWCAVAAATLPRALKLAGGDVASEELQLLRRVFDAVDRLDGHETYDKRIALHEARIAYRRWQGEDEQGIRLRVPILKSVAAERIPQWDQLAQIAREGCYQVVGDVILISKHELATLGRRAGYRSDEKYTNLDDGVKP